jgi:hypothetical protein
MFISGCPSFSLAMQHNINRPRAVIPWEKPNFLRMRFTHSPTAVTKPFNESKKESGKRIEVLPFLLIKLLTTDTLQLRPTVGPIIYEINNAHKIR